MIFSREALLWALIHHGLASAFPNQDGSFYVNSSSPSIPTSTGKPPYHVPVNEDEGRSVILSTSSPVPEQSLSGARSVTLSTSSSSAEPGRGLIFSTSSTSSTSKIPVATPPIAAPVPGPNNTSPGSATGSQAQSPSVTGLGSSSALQWKNSTSLSSGVPGPVTSIPQAFTTYTPPYPSSYYYNTSTSSCSTLEPDEGYTVWSILPNTDTVTITMYGNQTASISSTPDFTPPTYCVASTSSSSLSGLSAAEPTSRPSPVTGTISATFEQSSTVPAITYSSTTSKATTTIITSKQPVTVITTASINPYPGTSVVDKTTVQNPQTSEPVQWGPQPGPSSDNLGTTTIPFSSAPTQPSNNGGNGENNGGSGGGGVSTSIGTVPVIIQPGSGSGGGEVIVGGQTVSIPAATSTSGNGGSGGSSGGQNGGSGSGSGSGGNNVVVTAGGETITVNPSQVVGGGSTVNIPPAGSTPTTVAGVPIQLSPTAAVIDGRIYAIGNGAPETTIVAEGQTISIGPGGLGFVSTTVAPPPSTPTNVVIVDAKIFTVIGSSLAVIEGHTFTYGPSITPQIDVLGGETITIGPNGVSYNGTTLGGATAKPSATKYGIAGGLSVTEIGSTIAEINGMTFTVGPGVTPLTIVIDGHTIMVGPNGLDIDHTTLNYPFNPTTATITAGGVTLSEIGPSLVVIGGSTFTVGAGATPTTDVFNGQTISIGPSGVGFATTTVKPLTSTPTGTAGPAVTGKIISAGVFLTGPGRAVVGLSTCIAILAGLFL